MTKKAKPKSRILEAFDPQDFERRIGQSGAEFDGRCGLGGLEIWMPVKR